MLTVSQQLPPITPAVDLTAPQFEPSQYVTSEWVDTLVSCRKGLKVTQKKMAETLGISQGYLWDMEKHTRKMTGDIAKRYAEALKR